MGACLIAPLHIGFGRRLIASLNKMLSSLSSRPSSRSISSSSGLFLSFLGLLILPALTLACAPSIGPFVRVPPFTVTNSSIFPITEVTRFHSNTTNILESVPNLGTLELRGGSNDAEGNLFINNFPVCEVDRLGVNKWRLREAHVVCRMLGFTGATRAFIGCRFGRCSNNFGVAGIGCRGEERSVAECRLQRPGRACIEKQRGAGVSC